MKYKMYFLEKKKIIFFLASYTYYTVCAWPYDFWSLNLFLTVTIEQHILLSQSFIFLIHGFTKVFSLLIDKIFSFRCFFVLKIYSKYIYICLVDDDVTVGKFYATFLIQDYFRRKTNQYKIWSALGIFLEQT